MSEQTIFDILHHMDQFTNRLIVKWNQAFEEDLGVSHILTLGFLKQHGKTRPSEIAEALHLTPPTITHLSNKLVEKALINRIADEHDRRITNLEITNKGQDVLKRAHVKGQDLRQEAFLKLTGEERTELLRIYQKLND